MKKSRNKKFKVALGGKEDSLYSFHLWSYEVWQDDVICMSRLKDDPYNKISFQLIRSLCNFISFELQQPWAEKESNVYTVFPIRPYLG